MPPKAKCTREQIIDTAYEMVRKYGEDILSARNLASGLGTSTSPIFAVFNGIDEVLAEVIIKAKALYKKYLEEGLSQPIAFKGAGLKYIQFAKDEPELFKLLFMRSGIDEPTKYLPDYFEFEPQVRGVLKDSHSMADPDAMRIYNHLAVYTHGLAVLFAQGNCVFSDEDVSAMLSEVFFALKQKKE